MVDMAKFMVHVAAFIHPGISSSGAFALPPTHPSTLLLRAVNELAGNLPWALPCF